jgi:4-diphosphocytidyl-2-C-methyl-D-erythritol kinase
MTSHARSGLHAFAPAKVNLTLAVVGRRGDGFHALESVFARIGLYDELVVEPLATWERSSAEGDELVIEPADTDGTPAADGTTPAATSAPPYLASPTDLILRAAAALRRQAPPSLPSLRFRLTKRIPAAAGLGGGSSDAAAALVLAALAWDLELDHHGLLALAERLGSDVPFFASALRFALVRGRGESVVSLGSPSAPLGVLTITPAAPLPTPDVFAALGFIRERPSSPARRATAALADLVATGADPTAIVALAPELRDANDLWPAAVKVMPSLAWARDDLERHLGVPLLLSGSGPTLVGLYPSPAQASAAAQRLVAALPPFLESAAVHAADLPAAH